MMILQNSVRTVGDVIESPRTVTKKGLDKRKGLRMGAKRWMWNNAAVSAQILAYPGPRREMVASFFASAYGISIKIFCTSRKKRDVRYTFHSVVAGVPWCRWFALVRISQGGMICDCARGALASPIPGVIKTGVFGWTRGKGDAEGPCTTCSDNEQPLYRCGTRTPKLPGGLT